MVSTDFESWSLRPADTGDIDGICDVINAYSMAVLGIPRDARRDVVLTWGQPRFNTQTDTRVAVLPSGRILGYGEVEDTLANHARIGSWIRVHPDVRGQGIETALIEWIETRARTSVPLAPPEIRVALSQGTPDEDEIANALFQERGYAVIRHFLRMQIELDREIPEPRWPEGVQVRTFDLERDLEEMVHAYRDAFQDHWGHVNVPFEEDLQEWDHWIRNDPEFDPTLAFLAVSGPTIVGLSACDPTFSEDPGMGFIDVLGVRRAWRRRGIARALLYHTFREFQHRGQKRVGLGVDATSLTGANRVYEASGMRPARRVTVYEIVLRAGTDLSLQTLPHEEGET